MRISFVKGLALVALLALVAQPVAAQKAPKITGGSQIRLFETVAQFPYPSWHKSNRAQEESHLTRKQEANTFALAMVPKNESFLKWTKQYTLFGHWNEDLTLPKFINDSIHVFRVACGAENLTVRKILRQPQSGLVVVFCANSPKGPPFYGYGDGVGEVVVMWMGQFKNTFVKIYQNWRGKSFNVNDPTSWPVSTQRLDRSVLEFTGIKLLPYDP